MQQIHESFDRHVDTCKVSLQNLATPENLRATVDTAVSAAFDGLVKEDVFIRKHLQLKDDLETMVSDIEQRLDAVEDANVDDDASDAAEDTRDGVTDVPPQVRFKDEQPDDYATSDETPPPPTSPGFVNGERKAGPSNNTFLPQSPPSPCRLETGYSGPTLGR